MFPEVTMSCAVLSCVCAYVSVSLSPCVAAASMLRTNTVNPVIPVKIIII